MSSNFSDGASYRGSKSDKRDTSSSSGSKIWGGVFSQKADDLMIEINQSITFDKELYKQDIKASIAHASMLCKVQIITEDEYNSIRQGLLQIENEIECDKMVFSTQLEDIHMNIESRLFEIIGTPAKRLHTARSRNDQVATDFKLYVKDSCIQIEGLLSDFLSSILLKAEKSTQYLMPAYTHMQTAQPTILSHHLLCYFEMFLRDRLRFRGLFESINQSPLGGCAVTGTSFAIDRHYTASLLGFENGPMRNSLDCVSDRDFAIEFLSHCALVSLHLTRLMEELIVWCTSNFQFAKFSDKYSTGSSIMPQKKNPDACELIRGKSGRVYGNLVSLLVTMKSLPLAYSKDMQEDKEPVFDSVKTVQICLTLAKQLIDDVTFNKAEMEKSSSYGHSTATDLADYLVQKFSIPFRDSHHIVGSLVREATDLKKSLWELDISVFKKHIPQITSDVYQVLNVKGAVDRKTSYGGTASKNVEQMIEICRSFL